MNYYLDTEFIEDFTSRTLSIPSFRWEEKKHYIDLISIGIVSEDGREYYAVSKDFDLKHVWNKYDEKLPLEMGDAPIREYWLRENVLRPIYNDLCQKRSVYEKTYHDGLSQPFSYKGLKYLIENHGKTRVEIALEIEQFTAGVWKSTAAFPRFTTYPYTVGELMQYVQKQNTENPPTFYGYYCDYDWVVFCSLFGRMLDLPKGYPMYMYDLKQKMDELGLNNIWKDRTVPGENEHHALADARWNKKLHAAIKDVEATSFRALNLLP